MKYTETSLAFDSIGDAVVFSTGGSKIVPVFFINKSASEYPIFLPYQYGDLIRTRAIRFSVGEFTYVINTTISAGIYYFVRQ